MPWPGYAGAISSIASTYWGQGGPKWLTGDPTEARRVGVLRPGDPVTPDQAGAWLGSRVNPSNLAHAKRAWALVSPGYQPIDWHVDYKSGYRWASTDWYLDVPYGSVLGADVKAPWEARPGPAPSAPGAGIRRRRRR